MAHWQGLRAWSASLRQVVCAATACGGRCKSIRTRRHASPRYDCCCCLLQHYVPLDKLAEARRVLYGHNAGGLVRQIELPGVLYAAAAAEKLDLQAYSFSAKGEQLRPPQTVRAALIQNAIVEPTTAPYAKQLQACVWRDAKHLAEMRTHALWGRPNVEGCLPLTCCRRCTAASQTSSRWLQRPTSMSCVSRRPGRW